MPLNEEKTLAIECDNPDCPGNELDPADRMNWIFVTAEIYGQPSVQHIYCSPECAMSISGVLEESNQSTPSD